MIHAGNNMYQITVRQISDSLEDKLKALALKTGLSINKTVVNLLNKSLGLSESGQVKRDITGLRGTWSKEDEKEFKKNIKAFDAIDDELWSNK